MAVLLPALSTMRVQLMAPKMMAGQPRHGHEHDSAASRQILACPCMAQLGHMHTARNS